MIGQMILTAASSTHRHWPIRAVEDDDEMVEVESSRTYHRDTMEAEEGEAFHPKEPKGTKWEIPFTTM